MRRILAALVCAFLAAMPAHAAWREASSQHFVIYSQEGTRDLEAFAAKLERYDAMLRYRSKVPNEPLGPANRLTVFVVPDQSAVRRLHGGGSAGIAGFYIGRASGSYAFTPRRIGTGEQFSTNADIVLLHEYAHHFMRQNFSAAYPAWFIEGFAEFYSTARFERDGSVGIGIPAYHRGRNLFQGADLPIETLLTVSGRDIKPSARESIYGRGWLLTHYLAFQPSRSTQLGAYLRAINDGKPSIEAARAAFGDLKQLDKQLDRYLLQRSMSYLKIPADRIPIGRISIRELRPGEEAVINVRMRTKRGNRDAAELVPIARKAAAPHPDDPVAQATLAEAEFDAGNDVEAEAAADRALKADPNHVEALIFKGRAQMARAARGGVKDAAVWREVRRQFVAASRVDPDDPEPKILYFRSIVAQGRRPTANAAEALIEAHRLAPQDDRLRWMVAQQLLRDGRKDEARRTLAPLAFDPHGGPRAEAAAAILTRLSSGSTTAAQQILGAAIEQDKPGSEEP